MVLRIDIFKYITSITIPTVGGIGLLEQVHVTPRPEHMKALLLFTETVSHVKKAPIKLKKMLFNEKGQTRCVSNVLSKKILLS